MQTNLGFNIIRDAQSILISSSHDPSSIKLSLLAIVHKHLWLLLSLDFLSLSLRVLDKATEQLTSFRFS